MIDKLAGLWRDLGRHHHVNGVADGFSLRNFSAYRGEVANFSRLPHVRGEVQAWTYLVAWNNSWPIYQIGEGGLCLDLDVDAQAGELEFGLLAADGKTFVSSAGVGQGKSHITLEASRGLDVSRLVLRNRRDGQVDIRIIRLSSRITAGGRTVERGFFAKNAMDDLVGRLACSQVTIIDVGANRGDTVAAFRDRFPEARIWALEPHPATFAGMASRFADDARVHPRNLALSDRRGRSLLHTYSNAAINSLSPVADGSAELIEGAVAGDGSISIDHLSLSDFWDDEGLSKVDILKLDTQGHELTILEGNDDLLRSGRIKYILAELLFAPLYTQQGRAGRIISLLETCGYQVFDFYDFVYNERAGLKWGDALFVFVGEEE